MIIFDINKLLLIALLVMSFSAKGIEEKRVKIAIIDSGLVKSRKHSEYLCKDGVVSLVEGDNGYDTVGHGTNIFHIIKGFINPETHCIVSFKVFGYMYDNRVTEKTIESLRIILKDKSFKYVNISLIGDKETKDDEELDIYKKLTNRGVTVVTSAGNEGKELTNECEMYPACYRRTIEKNFYIVGSYTGMYSNYGPIIDVFTDGSRKGVPVYSGTSQAAAVFTGAFVIKNKKMWYYNKNKGKKP